MNKILKVEVTRYRCSICGTDYDSEADALLHCGELATEPPHYKEGDRVRRYGEMFLAGEVTEVIGPVRGNPIDTDGRRIPAVIEHVYKFRVEFPNKKEPVDLFASELIAV